MAAEITTKTLIRTKLNRPPVGQDFIYRPHLLERLEERRQRPLTLVSAPAGYGKTTLVSGWLEACDCPYGWVSLDKNDNDLRLFLSYVLAAVQTIFSDVGRKTLTMVNALTLPSVSLLADSLINELELIEQPFMLALDDFHLIKDVSVRDLVTQLLHYPPQAMHLVLIGRRDPPLPISTLRAKSLMTEIRTQDLRFNELETGTFLTRALGTQVDSATVAALEEKTEGWVTGLRLAALSMSCRDTLDPKLLEPQVDAQYVMEYLFTEVFSVQPPEINQYLLGTAILDRFCGPLCEEVCIPGVDPLTCEFGGWNFIAWLKRENAFLIPLDPENHWFRYHHLFQKFLVNQLKRHCSTEQINTLHAQASAWFVENGLIEEGLRHSLAAGDIPEAIHIVARHGHNLMNDQQWPRLERWLEMLPRERVEQNPELLLMEAWIYHIRHHLPEMAACIDKVEILISTSLPGAAAGADHIRGHYDALRGFQSLIAADGERALIQTLRACENIPRKHERALAFAHLFLAGAYQMAGDLGTGLSSLHKAAGDNVLLGDAYYAHYLVNPCYLYWMAADLTAMRQSADRSLKIDKDHHLLETFVHGLYFQGIAHYHRNELQIAEEKLVAAVKDSYAYHGINFAHSSFALALTYLARGLPGKAGEVSESVVSYALDTNNSIILEIARAFQAELALRQGRLAEASNWAGQFVAKPFLLAYRFYEPQLTLVKILLAQDTSLSREQAADLIKELYDFFVFTHNTCFQIDVLALQALLHDTLGDGPIALESLTKALDLAEPGGFICLFVDLGPQMADLLKQLIQQNIAVNYAGQILSAFSEDARSLSPSLSLPVSPSPRHPIPPSPNSTFHTSPFPDLSTSQPLVQPLTNRESEILDLLGQRLQNKEIAARLSVSPETVKKHLNNIYGKLNVSGRRQAVEKAEILGILTRP
jgi:LuxR family maltose regulon positive regulatory protein